MSKNISCRMFFQEYHLRDIFQNSYLGRQFSMGRPDWARLLRPPPTCGSGSVFIKKSVHSGSEHWPRSTKFGEIKESDLYESFIWHAPMVKYCDKNFRAKETSGKSKLIFPPKIWILEKFKYCSIWIDFRRRKNSNIEHRLAIDTYISQNWQFAKNWYVVKKNRHFKYLVLG